jgi:hypothetical protein
MAEEIKLNMAQTFWYRYNGGTNKTKIKRAYATLERQIAAWKKKGALTSTDLVKRKLKNYPDTINMHFKDGSQLDAIVKPEDDKVEFGGRQSYDGRRGALFSPATAKDPEAAGIVFSEGVVNTEAAARFILGNK